jgi:alkylation response protein AidB-like acyl-CoA dehydrogenase
VELSLDDEQAAFRAEVRAWLEANVPAGRPPRLGTRDGIETARQWERRLHQAGFAAVHWPVEFGGRGMDPVSTLVFYEEYLRAGAPPRLNRLGLGLAGPTLIELGTAEQRKRWLSRILSCDDLWCQGFSEPGAGSDLASVRTKGELRDDGILVTGQKIWTSQSRFADWMFALVRTDPESRRSQGLTFLMIDMTDPGIEVRPIRQINHASEFGEVFLTDVLVPYENVIDRVNNGWQVAMRTLVHERGVSLNTASHFSAILGELIAVLPPQLREDAHVISEIGWLHEHIEAYRYMTLRTLSQLAAGKKPTRQASMGKLWWSELQVRMYELGLYCFGSHLELRDGEPDDPLPAGWRQRYWVARAAMIFAGTNEIQRNIIAERELGLPREPRHAV